MSPNNFIKPFCKEKVNTKYKPNSPSYTFTSKNKKPYQNIKGKPIYKKTSPSDQSKVKHNCWLDGTFFIDPLTWETKHIQNCSC